MSKFLHYLDERQDHLIQLTLQHAEVVAIALAIATAISVTLGVVTYRRERAANAVLAVAGVFLTIPSFALLALLIEPFGLGYQPTIIALVMYALLPIIRNTVAGLRTVDPSVIESARGMGMSRLLVLWRIELPLAWPVIITGVRVAAVMLIGIAAIAAAVNGPGLGRDIFDGLARVGSATAINVVLGGMLGIVVLALVFDGAFLGLQKLTTSRGIRD